MKKPSEYFLNIVHGERVAKRQIDELIGICKAALFDGHIDQNEAEGILNWLNHHIECLDMWPANVLNDRLRKVLEDGVLDDQEERELLDLVMKIAKPDNQGAITPTSLPFTSPIPEIEFSSRTFCFTGVFEFGSREQCKQAVIKRGGVCLDGVTKKLHYLVIGSIGSEHWQHSTFGAKIAKAVEYVEKGAGLYIVSESHWISKLAE